MLGTETIKITSALMIRACDIDAFKGLWTGLEAHTTGLNMLRDVARYGEHFKRVLGPLHDKPFTPEMIAALALQNAAEKPGGAVESLPYKTTHNPLVISQGAEPIGSLETAAPEDVQPLLAKLVDWTNKALDKGDLHPLVIAAVFMAIFLQISPFPGNNIKLAQLLVMLIMLKSGYSYAPYAPLERAMSTHARYVFVALSHNQQSLENGRPDWSEWLACFFHILQTQKDDLHARLRAQDKDLSHVPGLSAQILRLFEAHQRLQMKQIIKLTNGRRSTIKLRIGELVEQGYLNRRGGGRSTWYSLN